jgi:tetratricopeptide (TPR) repeat protein
VNLHLFFGAGVLLVGGFLFEKIVLNYRHFWTVPIVKKLALLFILLTATCFLSAYGLAGALFSLKVNVLKDGYTLVSAETYSLHLLRQEADMTSYPGLLIFPVLMVLLGVSFFFGYKKKPLFYLLASAATAALTFLVIRSVVFFGLMFLPAITLNFQGLYLWAKQRLKEKSPDLFGAAAVMAPVLLLSIVAYFTVISPGTILPYTSLGIGLSPHSEEAAHFFKTQGLSGPILNDTDIGSYLIYELYPDEQVFSDNRFGDAYSPEFFSDVYVPTLSDDANWPAALEKYHFNTIFFFQYSAGAGARDFLYRRIYDPEWAWVYADEYAVILVRNSAENKDVIEKFQITEENVAERLAPLLEGSLEEKVAVADIYSLIGYIDNAKQLYLQVVAEEPERGKIWFVLGKTELTRADQENADPASALLYMKNAIEHGNATREAYSYLALAYFNLGDLDNASKYVEIERRISPDSQDVKDWDHKLEEARKAPSP